MKNIGALLLALFSLGPWNPVAAKPPAGDDIGYQIYLLKNRVDEHGNRLEVVERRVRNFTGRTRTDDRSVSPAVNRSVQPTPARTAVPPTRYVVRSGDSLWGLSRRFGVSVDTLREANRLEGTGIYTGQALLIPGSHGGPSSASPRTIAKPSPAPGHSIPGNPSSSLRTTLTHTVVQGDTLFGIARRHGSTIAEIQQANGITDADSIRTGQPLLVPVPAGTPGAQESPAAPRRIAHARPKNTVIPGRHPVSLAPRSARASQALLSYTFQSHDTLESIADIFATTTPELRRINKLGTSDRPAAGSTILVPTSGIFYDIPAREQAEQAASRPRLRHHGAPQTGPVDDRRAT